MKKLIVGGLAALALALGLGMAPTAHAGDINREVCLAVMALYVNPNDDSGTDYALGMLERYPNMTYSQAKALVVRAYHSVQFHANPMCNGITIPPNY